MLMCLKIQVTIMLVSKKWLDQANLVKKMTPQQLRRSERIQKPNSKYVNTAIIEDEIKKHHKTQLDSKQWGKKL